MCEEEVSTEFLNSYLDWEKNGTNKSQHQNNKTNKIMLALGEFFFFNLC
jgi:membrane protein insertase Oxa1/YidC/SpoIIIJ